MPRLHTLVKILFAVFLVSLFAGCSSQDDTEITTFHWEPNNLSINFPSSYHTVNFDSVLVVTESENDLPLPGEKMMELMLIMAEMSAEEAAAELSFYSQYSTEEVTIGDIEAIRVNYGLENSDEIYTMLITDTPDGRAVEFVPGIGHEDFGETVMATLTFNETTTEE